MQSSNFSIEKILFSIVDEIADEQGKNHLVEVKFTKAFFRRFVSSCKKSIIFDFQNEFNITKREIQVLTCLSQGKNNIQIAKKLNVSVHTAKAHIQNIFKKLCVTDRTEAVVKAIKDNLIEI